MTTSIYVARFLGVDTDVLGPSESVGTIVGGDTALDTNDGDTSYAQVSWTGITGAREAIPFRWELLSGPVPNPATVATITVELVARKDAATTVSSAVSIVGSTGHPDDPTGGSTGAFFASTTEYVALSKSVDPFYTEGLTSGIPWRIQPLDPGAFDYQLQWVTMLRAVIEHAGGPPPLRQRNRDTIRARNRPSRQRGIRQRGYL